MLLYKLLVFCFFCKHVTFLGQKEFIFRPRGKESTEVRKSQIKEKESENSYQELKRSRKDRHTQTHGNCIEIFRQVRPSFSVGRE